MRKLKKGDKVLIINKTDFPEYIGKEGIIKSISKDKKLLYGTWGYAPIRVDLDEYTPVSKYSFF